jgi:crotonobetaine/carnitine-CoA ligase
MTAASHPRPADECVLGELLARGVSQYPDRIFVRLADGAEKSYAEITRSSAEVGCGLQALGVHPGELVLSWLPNGLDAVEVWFGANLIGAVFAPINIANRGAALEHAVNLTKARVMICTAELHERLAGLDLPHLRRVILADADAAPPAVARGLGSQSHQVQGRPALRAPVPASGLPEVEGAQAPWDVLAVVQTSGTTGPS